MQVYVILKIYYIFVKDDDWYIVHFFLFDKGIRNRLIMEVQNEILFGNIAYS